MPTYAAQRKGKARQAEAEAELEPEQDVESQPEMQIHVGPKPRPSHANRTVTINPAEHGRVYPAGFHKEAVIYRSPYVPEQDLQIMHNFTRKDVMKGARIRTVVGNG